MPCARPSKSSTKRPARSGWRAPIPCHAVPEPPSLRRGGGAGAKGAAGEGDRRAGAIATRWLLGTKERVRCGDSGPAPERLRVMRIEKTVGISRPPEEVWTFIADARNDPQWCDKVDSVDQIAGEGPGRDARYRMLHRPDRLRKAKELAVTVEEYEPPRQLRFREDDDDAIFEVTYRLAETAEGTELTQIDE